MKTKIKIISGIILAIIVVITIYTQLYAPVVVEIESIKCVSWDATYITLEALADAYSTGEYDKTTTFIHSFNGKLPSENPNDYMDIYCKIKVKNRNIIDDFSVDAAVSELGKNSENVLFSFPASCITKPLVFKSSENTITFILDIYIGNMTESEIKELVQGMKAKFVYSGKYLGKREKIISFKNCEKKINIKFAD